MTHNFDLFKRSDLQLISKAAREGTIPQELARALLWQLDEIVEAQASDTASNRLLQRQRRTLVDLVVCEGMRIVAAMRNELQQQRTAG